MIDLGLLALLALLLIPAVLVPAVLFKRIKRLRSIARTYHKTLKTLLPLLRTEFGSDDEVVKQLENTLNTNAAIINGDRNDN